MTNINIRIDEDLKRQAEEVLSGLGMNMTTATTVFLKQVVRTGGIPFPLTTRSAWEEYVEHALDEADEEAKHPGPRIDHEEFMRKSRALIDELSRQVRA